VQVEESAFDQMRNTQAYESLKKLRKSRVDQHLVREVSERAFHFIESRDKISLMREIEKNPAVSIVDIVDHRGYSLLHMACFKNLEEIGI
jgi:hypothetical protein